MNTNRLGFLRIAAIVLTLLTAAMAFLPMLKVVTTEFAGFDVSAEEMKPEVSARQIDGMLLLALCSLLRGFLLTRRRVGADIASILLTVICGAWVACLPRLLRMVKNLMDNMGVMADAITADRVSYAYGLNVWGWLLLAVNALCLLLTSVLFFKPNGGDAANA